MALNTEAPICVPCAVNMKVSDRGILVRLTTGRIIYADLYRCPDCDRPLITGFAKKPLDQPLSAAFEGLVALMGDAPFWSKRDGRAIS